MYALYFPVMGSPPWKEGMDAKQRDASTAPAWTSIFTYTLLSDAASPAGLANLVSKIEENLVDGQERKQGMEGRGLDRTIPWDGQPSVVSETQNPKPSTINLKPSILNHQP
jgi:hypothetical protein